MYQHALPGRDEVDPQLASASFQLPEIASGSFREPRGQRLSAKGDLIRRLCWLKPACIAFPVPKARPISATIKNKKYFAHTCFCHIKPISHEIRHSQLT